MRLQSEATVQELISLICMKMGYGFKPDILVNKKTMSDDDKLCDLIGRDDSNCLVSLIGYLLGGAHTWIGYVPHSLAFTVYSSMLHCCDRYFLYMQGSYVVKIYFVHFLTSL